MRLQFLYLFIFVLGLCLGCSSGQERSTQKQQASNIPQPLPDFSSINTAEVFVYECGDSLEFTAHVSKDSTWLFLPDTTLKVQPVKAGSGAKYEGNAYLYWSKGDEAILQKPEGSLLTCKTLPEEKAWRAAKLRGVDFRALGQEPGWNLEITKGEQIRFVGNYGQDTVFMPVSTLKIDNQERTVFQAETEAHNLTVEIINKPCTDNMSGFPFPASVSVTVDGQTYSGCGKKIDEIKGRQ